MQPQIFPELISAEWIQNNTLHKDSEFKNLETVHRGKIEKKSPSKTNDSKMQTALNP